MTSPLVVVQLVAVAVLWIVAFVLACRVRRLGDEVIVLLRRNHDLRCDLDRAEQLGEQLAEQLAVAVIVEDGKVEQVRREVRAVG